MANKLPILLLGFNRPDSTRRVLNEIRTYRPTQLFIAIDGPRANNSGDIELCKQTREITKEVDWFCEVKTLFRDNNHGCLMHIGPAIDWFFENVDAGIMFEDDCIPDQSFFSYCEELIEKYKYNPKVMHISGNNFQHNNPRFQCTDSYYFSRIPHCWGWATWKRAWNLYDRDIRSWSLMKAERKLQKIFNNDAAANRWEYLFDQDRFDHKYPGMRARVDWDGRWAYACLMNEGLCIIPRVNLVSNIGFNDQARMARNPNDPLANLPTHQIEKPLKHPEIIEVYTEAEKYTYREIFQVNKKISQRIKWFLKSKLGGTYQYLHQTYKNIKKYGR